MSGWFTYGAPARVSKALVLLLSCASPAAAQESLDILALGDSLTQGYGLFDDEGFVPQLRGWLAAQGQEVRIVNGGVSGDTSAGGLARVDWSLTPEIDAMIVTLGGNDLLRGIAPEVTRANIEGILQAAAAKDVAVLLVGMEAPGNYGPEYKAAFDALYPELAQAYGTLFFPSFFAGLQTAGGSVAELAPFMQPDGIHPNAEGVARIVAAIGPEVVKLLERAGD